MCDVYLAKMQNELQSRNWPKTIFAFRKSMNTPKRIHLLYEIVWYSSNRYQWLWHEIKHALCSSNIHIIIPNIVDRAKLEENYCVNMNFLNEINVFFFSGLLLLFSNISLLKIKINVVLIEQRNIINKVNVQHIHTITWYKK